MTRTGTSEARAAAFTLMELMVVIVLIGILTALITPEMRGSLGEALLRSGARQLVVACDTAYCRAVATGRSQRLEINQATGRYRVVASPGDSSRGGEAAPLDTPGATGTIDKRLSVAVRRMGDSALLAELADTPAGEAIEFYPDGTAEACELLLKDQGGFHLAIHINPVTSRVRITDKAPR